MIVCRCACICVSNLRACVHATITLVIARIVQAYMCMHRYIGPCQASNPDGHAPSSSVTRIPVNAAGRRPRQQATWCLSKRPPTHRQLWGSRCQRHSQSRYVRAVHGERACHLGWLCWPDGHFSAGTNLRSCQPHLPKGCLDPGKEASDVAPCGRLI